MALSLEVVRALPSLTELDRALTSHLAEHAVPERAAYVAKMALEEVGRNLLLHARNVTWDKIRMEIDVGEARLVLALEDASAPFDPREAPAPDHTVPLAERRAGGMGLELVRKLADGLRYERVGDRNRLEVDVAW